MALWHSFGHAAFCLRILARVAGVAEVDLEAEIARLWTDYAARAAWVQELAQRAAK